MNDSTKFFKSISIYTVVITVALIIFRILSFFIQLNAGIYGRLFILAYNIALILAFWGFTQKKINVAFYTVKTAFLFTFSYFILEATSFSLAILAGTQATPKWEAIDIAAKSDLTVYTAVIGRSLCFVGSLLMMIALVLYGVAALSGKKINKTVSIFSFIYLISLLIYTIGRFGGINAIYQIGRPLHSFIPPITILIIGLWLWKGKED